MGDSVGCRVGHTMGGGVLVQLGSGDGAKEEVGGAITAKPVAFRNARGPTSHAILLTNTRLRSIVGLLDRGFVGEGVTEDFTLDLEPMGAFVGDRLGDNVGCGAIARQLVCCNAKELLLNFACVSTFWKLSFHFALPEVRSAADAVVEIFGSWRQLTFEVPRRVLKMLLASAGVPNPKSPGMK